VAAEKRINFIKNHHLSILEIDHKSIILAEELFNDIGFPENAKDDSLHIAVSIINNIDYLLSWNFRHIANAHFKKKIETFCISNNYCVPTICTPEELNAGN